MVVVLVVVAKRKGGAIKVAVSRIASKYSVEFSMVGGLGLSLVRSRSRPEADFLLAPHSCLCRTTAATMQCACLKMARCRRNML